MKKPLNRWAEFIYPIFKVVSRVATIIGGLIVSVTHVMHRFTSQIGTISIKDVEFRRADHPIGLYEFEFN